MVTLTSLDDQIQITIKEGQNLLLGRLKKCDVVLEDSSISSQHARLKLQDNRLCIVDMGSTNGTRLNYSLLTEPGYVGDGDTLEFGNVTFVVDGPELTSPTNENSSPNVFTSLEPVDSSQQLAETMINLNLDERALQETEASHPPETDRHSAEEEDIILVHPERYAFVTALLLLLIGGGLLVLHLWKNPPL